MAEHLLLFKGGLGRILGHIDAVPTEWNSDERRSFFQIGFIRVHQRSSVAGQLKLNSPVRG